MQRLCDTWNSLLLLLDIVGAQGRPRGGREGLDRLLGHLGVAARNPIPAVLLCRTEPERGRDPKAHRPQHSVGVVWSPPVPDGGEEAPIGRALRLTVGPVTEEQPGLAAVLAHPLQVIGHPASDAVFRGVVLAQNGNEPRLVLADQLRIDGRDESWLVREVVIQRPDTHFGLAPNLVERGRERAVDREPAPRHVQQPVPGVGRLRTRARHEEYSSSTEESSVDCYSSVACSGSGGAGAIRTGPLLRMLLTSRDTSRISMRSRSPWPRSRPSSMGASGSSQRSQYSRLMVSGMRSWISASGPAASVVMIVQLSNGGASLGASFGRQVDHRPAMNSISPSPPYI